MFLVELALISESSINGNFSNGFGPRNEFSSNILSSGDEIQEKKNEQFNVTCVLSVKNSDVSM